MGFSLQIKSSHARRVAGAALALVVALGGVVAVPGAANAASSRTCNYVDAIVFRSSYDIYLPVSNGYPYYDTCYMNSSRGRSDLTTLGANTSTSYRRAYGPVTRLQITLNECYLEPAGKTLLSEDGIFGSKTTAALKYAQGRAGVTADGLFGPATEDALKWRGTDGNCHTF